MKNMKKLAAIFLAALIASSMAACGSQPEEPSEAKPVSPTEESTTQPAGTPYKIGIVQLAEHPALDASYQGFVDGLKESGWEEGKDFVVDYQNAQGEQANCQTIASKLVNDQNDLIFAIATPAAQAVASTTDTIPTLIAAVTDPADAKLVKSNEAPGSNITGTSDLTPVAEQMKLLHQLIPEAKTVGMLYCSSEANSKFQVNLAKAAAAELNLETVEATVSSSTELQQVAEALVSKVDVIYVPTDNMVSSGLTTVSMIAEPAGIPIIVGEEAMIEKGGLATYGVNYYNLGKMTAAQAVKILKDGANPAEMPIEYLTDCDLVINKQVAENLGITIPEDLAASAEMYEPAA